MRSLLGTHDLLFVTLDTLRFDVAAERLAAGRTPNLAKVLPGGVWERRHTPASFTYAAHHAFFGGFLPTPVTPGPHARPFVARFPGSTSVGADTWEFDAPDVVAGLRAEGYHTVCIGGVGFFAMTSPQGSVLPGLFDEAHWTREFGVTNPACFEAQLRRLEEVQPAGGPLFTFVNVAALHQPNRHYLADAAEDSVESHGAALEYVDRHLPALLHLATGRGRPCHVIMCSDHGTAYGESGHVGHRFAHEVVWTVPYAQFTLEAGAW
ncbi:STM4013/SEN3800 family hydrolase [Dactylosporangium sp. NPDC051541]|uniref:STM4013/SEN3800 family hydrolase n=1 Tax=Dactylosporangium sp. NPDC051541 TaxID=3363977 RepID=UPI0037AD90C0